MKLTISREVLLDLLNGIIGAVEKKHVTPILENALLRADNGGLSLFATDLEIEMSSSSSAVTVEQAGSITVPARKLLDICKALPSDTLLSFEVSDNQRLLIQGVRNRFELSTLPADEFPLLDDIPIHQKVKISEKFLKDALEKTAFAMANQDVRYYLNGLLLDLSEENLTFVSTDGHRLALSKVNGIETTDQTSNTQQIIIPRKGIAELIRLLKGDIESEIELQLSDNHIRVETESTRFTSKLIDGRYPDYAGTIPSSTRIRLDVDRIEFRDILQRVSILSNAKFKGIRLRLDTGIMLIQSQNPEREMAQEEMDINYSSEAMEIGFNVTYLLEAINHLKGEIVSIDINSSEASVLLSDPEDEHTRYIVMPIRL